MFAAQVSKLACHATKAALNPARQMSVMSGPPVVKISKGEQLIHGLAMSVGILIVPAWVLVHIREYRGLA